MTGLEVLKKIMSAKEQYAEKNCKCPDCIVISQNLYFRLYDYLTNNFSLTFKEEDFDKEFTIAEMSIKLISDNDFLMVGCNEILKLKGEK